MTSRARVGRLFPAVLAVAAAVLLLPERAHAQFGFGGFGGGMGFGFGFNQVPSPTGFIYQESLAASNRPQNLPSRNVYANNSNSYLNHVRDNGFVDRYSADRREMPSYRNAARPQAAAAPQVPSLPLSSFYNAENVLVWPLDSPMEGDLKEKRSVFDQSSEVVLSESKKNGVASMASVTDARNKLLDYGRPALAYTRAHDTPRISDSFHMFMLSLYESLAQAVNPGPTASAAPPTAR
jgi:hypothetical protein